MASGLNFLITYAQMGFSANPQIYIIKVEKSVQTVEWEFNRTKPTEVQTFPVEVSFQFVKVEQQEVADQLYKQQVGWQYSPDMFYGFVRYNSAT